MPGSIMANHSPSPTHPHASQRPIRFTARLVFRAGLGLGLPREQDGHAVRGALYLSVASVRIWRALSGNMGIGFPPALAVDGISFQNFRGNRLKHRRNVPIARRSRSL